MINLPVTDRIAFRASGFYEHDAGYIDNVFGERTYIFSGDPAHGGPGGNLVLDNSDITKHNFNDLDVYGGRAALKIDLDDNWTVTPTIMHQTLRPTASSLPTRIRATLRSSDSQADGKDKFTQVALTIDGKIANFDVTYAGAYMHRPRFSTSDYTDYTDAYEAYYVASGSSLLDYQYYLDNAGNGARLPAPAHYRHR